jgi:hypothetical protein
MTKDLTLQALIPIDMRTFSGTAISIYYILSFLIV